MEFTTTLYTDAIADFDGKIADSQSRIAELEAILQRERESLKDLQAERQKVLTAKGAADSALKQAIAAFRMADTIDPSGKLADELLDQIIEARKAIGSPRLEPADDGLENEPDPSPSPEPAIEVNAWEDESGYDPAPTIDVTLEQDEDSIGAIAQSEQSNSNGNGSSNGNGYASTDKLKGLTIQQLRRLTTAKRVSGKGDKVKLASRLKGLVTEADLAATA